jgi:hypothetical protein
MSKDEYGSFEAESISCAKEIRDRVIQELKKCRSENEVLKAQLSEATDLLYTVSTGLLNMHCDTSEDYFVAVELLRTDDLERWHTKEKDERLRVLRLNALAKLSDEEKKALGLI